MGVLRDDRESEGCRTTTLELDMDRGKPANIQREVEEMAENFLDQLQAGESPDRKAIVSANPAIAGPLQRRLALFELLFQARPR